MLFSNLNMAEILISIPITLIALSGHELAHGWVSTKLGDPTPRNEGRLTLNPLAHLDFMGTILMILTGFGWAKPVMVNPMYYRNRKGGMALVAVAGPLANFFMAFIGVLIVWIISLVQYKTGLSGNLINILTYAFQLFALRNLSFMVFNLIPIPPLDGSRVLGMIIPSKAYYTMMQYERYSMILIMILSLSGILGNFLWSGVSTVYTFMANLLVPLTSLFL